MRKSCVQIVGAARITTRSSRQLSTHLAVAHTIPWKKPGDYPPSMHNFCIQLCTPKMTHLTSVSGHSSPLSTAPITNTSHKRSKKSLVVSGG